jgi:hypothetical protein
MELSSELIEIESEKERNILASRFAKVCAACAFALLVGIVALVLAVGLSSTA